MAEGTTTTLGAHLPPELLASSLAEETKLPRELIVRFDEMWRERQRPFFSAVEDDPDNEAGTLSLEATAELIRTFKVSDPAICASIARVFAAGAQRITFSAFVRGYTKMHARTLREALPFAFAVFDTRGAGVITQQEFSTGLNANMAMQEMDATALNRVLKTREGQDAAAGVNEDAFRYFASLTAETILATCGFCMHVRDFYVPLKPLGSEAEERAEDDARREAQRRAREQEHARREAAKAGGEAGEGGEGGAAEGDEEGLNPFADADFLAALEALKTTPEERAERCKVKGNAAMTDKGGGNAAKEAAVRAYTEGLDEKAADEGLNATLLSNRAAAHVALKNWGKALADAKAALGHAGALPGATRLKCIRRAVSAAMQLGKLGEVEVFVAQGEAMAGEARAEGLELVRKAEAMAKGGGAEGGAEGGGGDEAATDPRAALEAAAKAAAARAKSDAAELAEIRKVAQQASKAREEERKRREAEAEEKARQEDVARAIKLKGVAVSDFADPAIREQCVGASSGAKVWYDLELDEMHWPLLMLYPEFAQSDFVQDFAESESLETQLVEMFGVDGGRSPPWDTERRYKAAGLKAYAPLTRPSDDKELMLPLRADLPLLEQLKRAQPLGYSIPGVPIVHVVVQGSEYEKRFFLDRLVAKPKK